MFARAWDKRTELNTWRLSGFVKIFYILFVVANTDCVYLLKLMELYTQKDKFLLHINYASISRIFCMIKVEECIKPFCFILKCYIHLKKKNIILFKKCSVADEIIKKIMNITKAKIRIPFITLSLDVTDSLHSFRRKCLSHTKARIPIVCWPSLSFK